jgi:hypothetical protein
MSTTHQLRPASYGPHVREAQSDIHDPPRHVPRACPTPRLRRLPDRHHRLPLPVPTRNRTRPSRSEVVLYVTEVTLGGRAPLATKVRSVARPIRRSAPQRRAQNDAPNGGLAASPSDTERHVRARCRSRARDAGSVVQATIFVGGPAFSIDHMAARIRVVREVVLSGACAGDGERGWQRGRGAAHPRPRVTGRSRAASEPRRI